MNKSALCRTILPAVAVLAVTTSVPAADPNFVEPDVDVLYSIFNENPGDGLGWVADPIGDINSDGAPDFVTSAINFAVGDDVTGKAYVFSGADGALLHSIVGDPGEVMGYSATYAGDVNNDGTGDYIVGTRVRTLVMSGADHSVLHEWIMPGEAFGFDSNTAGDLDGDGHDDVIVGAPFWSGHGFGTGKVYAYSGSDGSLLWSITGSAAGDFLGLGLGPVGDINDDTVPDVVVSSVGAASNGKGIAFVLSGVDGSMLLELEPKGPSRGAQTGKTFGVFHAHGAGDINNDGIPDIFVGDYNGKSGQHNAKGKNSAGAGRGRAFIFSGLDGSILMRIEGEEFGDGMGPGRGVEDINGDGHDDVYVAAYQYGEDESNFDVGRGYLISGADGEIIRTMTGSVPFGYLGVDALAMGDVNNDGLTDYLLTGWGSVHLVLGN